MADSQENKSFGTAIINTDKASPKSYDLKGTIEVDGTKYRFGAYKSAASGKHRSCRQAIRPHLRGNQSRRTETRDHSVNR